MIKNPFSSLMLSSCAVVMSVCMIASSAWPTRFCASDSLSDLIVETDASNPSSDRSHLPGLSEPDESTKNSIRQAYGKLPLQFIENQGQADSPVAYYAKDRNTDIYFTSEGVTISLTSADPLASGLRNRRTPGSPFPAARSRASRRIAAKQRWALKLDFVGSNRDVKPKGTDQSASVISYFKGSQSKSRVSAYAGLIYENLWPNIDLLYAGASSRLKYTFVVKPGGDINQIKLAYRGATAARISSEGRLQIDTPLGSIEDDNPYSYQETGGQRADVAMRYEIKQKAEGFVYGFRSGMYDRSKPLIIDPVVLVYAGYVGGAKDDLGTDIAVDKDHNAYITGSTASGAKTFPVTAGFDKEFNGGDSDAFVAKISPDGSALIYCSYIGGDGLDEAVGVAVDSAGSAYVVGDTDSKKKTFPVKTGPALARGDEFDAFVAKINPTGDSLIYCGYIGGDSCDFAGGIAVDSAGNAYILGDTASKESTFPVTTGPDLTFNSAGVDCDEDSPNDAFVAKVNATGTALLYCGYIGGSGIDEAIFGGIAVDDAGNAYVTGRTNSNESTFPVAVGPDLTYNGGRFDVFVAKVKASGEALDYCGYIGGSGADGGLGSDIAVDRAGNAYVISDTTSAQSSFPLAVGPDLIKDGHQIVFVAKVKASGEALDYCGYIEGKSEDESSPGGIAVDNDGNAYVIGDTTANETNFPVAVGPDLTFNEGDVDVFVAKINPAGTALIYCGYIGGGREDFGDEGGIAVDDSGDAYAVGQTVSKAATFPVTVGPGLEPGGGESDMFVAKVSLVRGFALRQDSPVVTIGRGKSINIKILIDRDPDFTGPVTVTPQSLDEKGIQIIPEEPVSTLDEDVKFKLKIKSGAKRDTRRLFFTGSSADGTTHTSAITVIITK